LEVRPQNLEDDKNAVLMHFDVKKTQIRPKYTYVVYDQYGRID